MSSAIKTLVTDKLTEAAAMQTKLAALQTEIEAARTSEMRQLHTVFGFASPAEFVIAYKNATGDIAAPVAGSNGTRAVRGSRKATRGAHGNGRKATRPAKTANGRKPRVSITPERREEIKKFFKNDGTTMEAMTKFDISYATAQNIKDEAGMVEHRK